MPPEETVPMPHGGVLLPPEKVRKIDLREGSAENIRQDVEVLRAYRTSDTRYAVLVFLFNVYRRIRVGPVFSHTRWITFFLLFFISNKRLYETGDKYANGNRR